MPVIAEYLTTEDRPTSLSLSSAAKAAADCSDHQLGNSLRYLDYTQHTICLRKSVTEIGSLIDT